MAAYKQPAFDGRFLEKFPDCVNVLILGKTGVGKSTFINGLVNYFEYGTMEEALKGQVEILIKTRFTQTDDSDRKTKIECEPTIVVERGEEANEDTAAGRSATQSPKSYIFSWGPEESKKSIRIIDTPGVGDVRGLDKEKENFAKVLNFIADFEEIHAICILLTPDEPRLNLTFRYCINELLAHLHKSACDNIIFCFTKARQSQFKPGDSVSTLEVHLEELDYKRGIKIPLNKNTMFHFDNEPFRYLCAQREGVSFNRDDVRVFKDSWKKSVAETFRLFERISELTPHRVSQTLSVNNIRSVILSLSRPLAEIARLQLVNMKLIEEKEREVNNCLEKGKALEELPSVDQLVIVPKVIDYPITVCTAKDCVKYMRFTNTPCAPLETVYKTECHQHCYLQGVQAENCPNVSLQYCWAMEEDINKCRICGCPWNTHMHIRYQLEKTMEKVVDPKVEKMIEDNRDHLKVAQAFLDCMKQRKLELVRDHEKISKSCVEFAGFLRQNSFMPYNDAYKEYIGHLIREEKDKVSEGASDALLWQLEAYKSDYEEQVNILKSHGVTMESSKTIDEIYAMVDALKKMTSAGSMLVDAQNLELISVRKQQITQATHVDLNRGWFGKMASRFNRAFKAVKNTVLAPFNAMKNIASGSSKKKTEGHKNKNNGGGGRGNKKW